jgi:predicted secreted protein
MKFPAVLLFFTACGTASPGASNEDTMKVKLNEPFEIKLGVSMGTGYSWYLADSAYHQFIKPDSTFISDKVDLEGGPETQVFSFHGYRKGQCSLHFIHRRAWRKEDPPSKEKKINIIIE